mmetsp:Transcript_20714/g.34183  ORF Transcript_20714/g.34183 Transcript_20714/m.34183 type:complete len:232 (+) Transcript_20714:341-1036(+)
MFGVVGRGSLVSNAVRHGSALKFSASNLGAAANGWRSMSTALHGTTILSVRKGNQVVVIGDGQVSLGNTVMKGNALKVRRLGSDEDGGAVLAGFAGSTADALTLIERLEKKLEQYPGQLSRACVELAKLWRTDKYLRKLEAMLLVVDKDVSLTLTGMGDVIAAPDHGVMAIGSGGLYALSAARALVEVEDDNLTAEEIAKRAMTVASEICVFTNDCYTVEVLNVQDEVSKK